jgi:hypothetical protein
MVTYVWKIVFELRFLLYFLARPDGKPHRPDGVSIFPYSELGKNLKLIDHWWTSGRAAEMSRWMQAGTEASRYSEGSRRKNTLSGQMMLVYLASRRDDTSSRRLTGNMKSFIFFSVQSLLKMLWKVESLFTTSLHICDFVQTEWGENTNKLPLWPFWDKNHFTSLEIHSWFKNKNYSPFLSQRDKG